MSVPGNLVAQIAKVEKSNAATKSNFLTAKFTDANINGGLPTPYYLEFSAHVHPRSPIGSSATRVSLDRIVFETADQGAEGDYVFGASYVDYTPVPEPGAAALAMLAAGAVGVTRRRRKR